MKTRVRKFGNSLGVILPAAQIAHAGFKDEDYLEVIAVPGRIFLTMPATIYVDFTVEEAHAVLHMNFDSPAGKSALQKISSKIQPTKENQDDA